MEVFHVNKKRFTLIELIVAVVVVSILASIVLVKILDMKNKSISAAISNNTKIIQTAVDRYALDNNNEYPIKNNLAINLQNPQLIDIELLKTKGYLKKELDTSKIKKQHYWLDTFGVAWGSTENTVDNIMFVKPKDDSKSRLEFITPAGAVAYRVYEVIGYSKTGEISNNQKDRHYKIISEVKLNKKIQKVSFEIPNSNNMYLISAVDKYEQETAPVGVFYKGPASFKPILNTEGKYEFHIDSLDEMFWIDFRKSEDTPGDSTITYRFKVKDENGIYGEWTNDYFSLASSKGLTVEVDMKGDAKGNKPSLYDLRVVYRYAYEEDFPLPPVTLNDVNYKADTCPLPSIRTTYENESWVQGQPKILSYIVSLPEGKSIEDVEKPSLYGHSIISVKYEYATEDGTYVSANGTFDVPAGSCVNIIYEVEENARWQSDLLDHENGGGSTETTRWAGKPIPPTVYVCEDNCTKVCKDCVPTCLENCASYCDHQKCSEEELCKYNECINPPVCNEGDAGCIPPVCKADCVSGPPTTVNPKDLDLSNADWLTVDELRFFAHGPDGTPTRWYQMIADDEQDKVKTRIVYRFAVSNGTYWSSEIEKIENVGQSQSLMVIAYLQVHKDAKDEPSLIPPKVNSIRILHEKGAINLDMLKPTLTILPKKNNNEGRDVFSDASIFEWNYAAVDPKGRKIVEVEWQNKSTKYPVGKHTIKARVKNETALWSEWMEYKFEVLSEKPVAKISKNFKDVFLNKNIIWSAAQSTDPDGDKIIKTEWRGDKQSVYDKEGTFTVGLRVQDAEGNWSDWTEEVFNVSKEGSIIYRLEAEDSDTTRVLKGAFSSGWSIPMNVSDLRLSGKNGVKLRTSYSGSYSKLTFNFKGTGFDLVQFDAKRTEIYLDGVKLDTITQEGEHKHSVRGLQEANHSIVVQILNTNESSIIDYIDIFGTDDTPEIKSIYSKQVDSNNNESAYNSNTLVTSLKQKVKMYFTLHKNSYVSILVLNEKGENIRTIQNKVFLQGGTVQTHSSLWDGKDNSNSFVPSGNYQIRVIATGVDEIGTVNRDYMVVVDSEKPIYRIEAESPDKTKVYKGSDFADWAYPKDVIDSNLSGGQGVKLYSVYNSSYTQLTFSFEGTGFDLSQLNPKASQIYLDGKLVGTISQTGEHIYSSRGLENKKHSVIVRVLNISDTSIIDYLDVYQK